jgi:glutathione S-transferase
VTKNIVYGIILSPYARKVYLTLEFKGVPYEAVDVRPHDDLPAFRAASYLGKVPGFEDDEVRISDSSVICDYLEQKYPTPALYPKAAAERAQALWLEEYADTRLQDLLLHGIVMERVIKPTVYAEPTDEQRVARILDEELPGELDYLQKQVGQGEFFVGGSLSIADIAIVTTFINATYAGFAVDHERWPRLATYLKQMYELPLVAQQMKREAEFLQGLQSQD